MNYRKFLWINSQPECIIVNIPEAVATYYKNGLPVIMMRSVVGRKKSPTPLMATYLTSIVTFPYWNVPFAIAGKELLPKVQENENYLEQHNFEIVDAKGNPVDDSELNWNDYNEKNFPYFFRQATGLDNSLGVLKFNLDNPFSIFLHSTSQKSSFAKDYRFLSHGCIRLEKPLELADALLRGKLDLKELKEGKKNVLPKTLELPSKIPVFITYIPVKVNDGKVSFLNDVYGLSK
jgi:murein L,D-transpeptidase YcbB/YkuD